MSAISNDASVPGAVVDTTQRAPAPDAPLFCATGALRPLIVRHSFALSWGTLCPETGTLQFVFLGQADRLLTRPCASANEASGVAVRGVTRSAGMTVTEFDPGPAVHVTVRLRRISGEGLRVLYSSLPGRAEDATTLLDRGLYDALRRRGCLHAAPGALARTHHLRAVPVLTEHGTGIVDLYRWQLEAPRAQFTDDGVLTALYLSGVALHDPLAARQSDPHFGLCGRFALLSDTTAHAAVSAR